MKKIHISGLAMMGAGSLLAQQPNIIYIMTDQQTAQAMSCVDATYVSTPNLDKLAKDGIRFTNAYCAAPLSGPSRFAMFTGVAPGSEGMLKNNTPFPEKLKEKTLGNLVTSAGYLSAYAGKWHLPEASLPANEKSFGFISLHDHNDYGLAESCIRFLKQKHDKPFFLVASFDNPHNICEYARNQVLPFAEIKEPDLDDCPNLPANFSPAPYEAEIIRLEQQVHFPTYPVIDYTRDDWRRYLNAYYHLVETVDNEIGKIIDALVELGLYEDALIIFSSDHGDGVAANKWNQKSALFEEIVNVPFIVKAPDAFSGNVERPELINAGLDLLPTICDYASVEIPSHVTGKSIRTLVEDKDTEEIHPFIVTETQFDKSPTRGWMVRTPQYKYVLYDKGKYREQLFDIRKDKKERRNLAIERKHQEILNHHRSLLQGWVEQHKISTTGREIILSQ
jgi:arylsulfatase A-like enzyme